MKAEQFIKDYTNHCSNEMVFEDGSGSRLYEPWLTPDQALRAVEIAREEMIDKACETFCKVRCNDKPPRSTCTSLGTCGEHDEFCKALKYSLENLI